MNRKIVFALIASLTIALNATATIVINFDTDAFGNPITAPPLLIDTVHLTELYAPLGVHFFGPDGSNGRNGGAIVDEAGNFGLPARSGRNVLGFNRGAGMMDGGVARDPETISFDTLASHVSIFAAGGFITEMFVMQAFGDDGRLVGNVRLTTQDWAELQITSPAGIRSVELSVIGPDIGIPLSFVYDDLSVDFIPEPSTISFLICAAALALTLRFRRGRLTRLSRR